MKAKKTKLPFVNFLIAREYLGRDGQWNPRWGKTPPFKGGLQINVFGRREHYMQLAAFLKEFAERDTSSDSDYHEHFEGLMSQDGLVRLNVILRKDDVGDSIHSNFFPDAISSKDTRTKSPVDKSKLTITCGSYFLSKATSPKGTKIKKRLNRKA